MKYAYVLLLTLSYSQMHTSDEQTTNIKNIETEESRTRQALENTSLEENLHRLKHLQSTLQFVQEEEARFKKFEDLQTELSTLTDWQEQVKTIQALIAFKKKLNEALKTRIRSIYDSKNTLSLVHQLGTLDVPYLTDCRRFNRLHENLNKPDNTPEEKEQLLLQLNNTINDISSKIKGNLDFYKKRFGAALTYKKFDTMTFAQK